ncbi:MAG: T9SS type A sorting domain-containing protein [Crocinitomicaceae bacterium]|nr:T9SS type A sorting domain-containing protein [Crocinitomicaceae bacterium]
MKIRIIVTLLSLFVVSHEVVLGQPLQFSISNITCNGQCDGLININLASQVNCGNGPYQYQIIGPSPSLATTTSPVTSVTSYTFGNLCFGNYNVNILVNGEICDWATLTVTQPPSLESAAVLSSPIICNGGTGVVTVVATGGTPPYTGLGNFNFTAGSYSLTITDANGCTSSSSVTIIEPLPILLTGSINANAIDISVSGGTAPYVFLWSNGATTEDLTNLSAGTYTVTVTDDNGCTSTESFTVDNAGLEQQESIELQVFPNPAQDLVSIRSSSAGAGNTYCILDCYGRNVLEGTLTSQENNINIQTLANGVYHLQLGANTVSFVVSH